MLNIKTTKSDHLFCPDCGEIHFVDDYSKPGRIACRRCGAVVINKKYKWIERCFALSVTGIVLFILANIFPFIGLEAAGFLIESNLLTGVLALISRDQWLLAALLMLFIFIIPLIELLGFIYLITAYYLRNNYAIELPGIRHLLKAMFFARPWSMLEIFLIGVLVTSTKLGDLATIVWGASSFAFIATVVVLTYLQVEFNREQFWRWYDARDLFLIPEESNTDNLLETCSDCHCCRAKISKTLMRVHGRCPRCNSTVHERTPKSLEFSFALTLAAIILYIPANVLPIMTTTQLGSQQSDTILSGVIHLAHLGSWGIAFIVFIASVFVPLAKILSLIYLMLSVKYGWRNHLRSKTILYRIVEFIGRWSMVDVFVVTVLVALVQFGPLANIEPAGAILAFAGVVILTMLAAEVFDQRMLWDNKNDAK